MDYVAVIQQVGNRLRRVRSALVAVARKAVWRSPIIGGRAARPRTDGAAPRGYVVRQEHAPGVVETTASGTELTEEFKQTASAISHYFFRYGIARLGAERVEELLKTAEGASDFFRTCHEGYWQGQDLLLAELQRVQAAQRSNETKLKAARRERQGDARRESDAERHRLAREEAVLRRLADGLAWTLLGLRRWEVRRLWQGRQQPSLADSNLESVMRILDVVRAEHQQFALICDLTSTIQMGDLILVQSDARRSAVIEVKEGAKNAEISEFLNSFLRTGCLRVLQYFNATATKHDVKQFERMYRQYERLSAALHFTSHDRGIDPRTGQELMLSDSVFRLRTYESELDDVLRSALRDGVSETIVDECVLVVAFRSDALSFEAYRIEVAHRAGHFLSDECLLPDISQEETMNLDGLLDWSRIDSRPWELEANLFSPDVQPLFLLAVEPSLIESVAFGGIRVALVLHLERFVDLLRHRGLDVELRETTRRTRAQEFHKSALAVGGCYIVARSRNFELTLGSGYKARMLLEAARPSSVAEMIAADLQERRFSDLDGSAEPETATDL